MSLLHESIVSLTGQPDVNGQPRVIVPDRACSGHSLDRHDFVIGATLAEGPFFIDFVRGHGGCKGSGVGSRNCGITEFMKSVYGFSRILRGALIMIRG